MSRPKQPERRELWRQRIAQQQASGQSVRGFCRDHKLSEHSFYQWRKQLESAGSNKRGQPIRFALVETTRPHQPPLEEPIELILTSGETLRIPRDLATLRLVLEALQNEPAT